MAKGTNRIKVNSLEFSSPPFRKLKSLKINFADRITLIAGHNGIGKSTILGLVVNTFGLTKGAIKSYFGDPFFTNIEQIIYIALDEVTKAQDHTSTAPIVEANIAGKIVRKRCAMTQRSEWKRARVVPRTVYKDEGVEVGQDAKIPLPTIYLGVKRLASAGEADEKEILSTKIDMHKDDATLMTSFTHQVIIGANVTDDITHQSIKGSKKKTAQPGYENHDALAVSLGQDSLASIATALASFSRIKRERGDDYEGGLLVIDELDIGFHPHAIERLIKSLKAYANKLDLQIIATTHSPRLIEAMHPDGDGNEHAPDKVIYLVDTKHPRLAEDQSLTAILDDMALRVSDEKGKNTRNPTMCVYFEDMEGLQFCGALLSSSIKSRFSRKYGFRINPIALGVGGSNLIALPGKDPIFKNRLIVVDADTSVSKKNAAYGNIVKLPCVKGAKGTDRSPENIIKKFLRDVYNAEEGQMHDALLNFKVTNPSSDKVYTTFLQDAPEAGGRETNKTWWRDHWDQLNKWQVIQAWASCYKGEVNKFISDFESAMSIIAKRYKQSCSK